MSIIKPGELKDTAGLLDQAINDALSKHPIDVGILKVDVSAITTKYDKEKCDELALALCKRLEEAGYYPWFMTYYTFFTHINIFISIAPIERRYFYLDNKTGEIKNEPFEYKIPYYGFISEESLRSQHQIWHMQKQEFFVKHAPKDKKSRSLFAQMLGLDK